MQRKWCRLRRQFSHVVTPERSRILLKCNLVIDHDIVRRRYGERPNCRHCPHSLHRVYVIVGTHRYELDNLTGAKYTLHYVWQYI